MKIKILILHGWGHNKQYWQNILDKLSGSYEVEAIDLPGFGEEELVDNLWGIPEYAIWLENYIKEEKFEDVVLVGHSFGGRIAAYLAINNPIWLKGLILYAAPVIFRPNIKVRMLNFLSKRIKHVFPKSVINLFKSNELQEADNNTMGNTFRRAVTFDITNRLDSISVKTHIIWGTSDKETSIEIGREMKQLIPESEIIEVPDVGHNFYLDNPDLFYGILKNVLETYK